MSELTDRIDDLLLEQNKTRKEMYKTVKSMHFQKFYEWSIETRKPYACEILDLANYLNTTTDFLLTGKVSPLENNLNELRIKLGKISKLSTIE